MYMKLGKGEIPGLYLNGHFPVMTLIITLVYKKRGWSLSATLSELFFFMYILLKIGAMEWIQAIHVCIIANE